jgi:TonB family protein
MTAPKFSAFLVALVASCLVAAARASAATCPYARLAPAADGTSYVMQVFDLQTYAGAVDVTLYAGDDAYDAHIPAIAVQTRDQDDYRSETIRLARPAKTVFEAATFTFSASTATSASPSPPTGDCTYHLIVDQKNPDPVLSAALGEPHPGLAPLPLLKVIGSTGALACEHRYRYARIDGHAVAPQYPLVAQEGGQTGRVFVRVALNADGSVANVSLYKSSGFTALDQAAMNAAAQTKYLPEVFRCEPIAGAYLFSASFSGR